MLTTSAQQILRRDSIGSSSDYPPEYWALVEQYRSKLMNQALSILANHADAEDVVQETFSKAFTKRGQMAKAGSLGAWLFSINKANAIDRLRVRRRAQKNAQRTAVASEGNQAATGGFDGIEWGEIVTRAVDSLPARLAAIALLRFVENRSHREISIRMNIPLGTVPSLVCEASMQLHRALYPLLNDAWEQSWRQK